MEKYKLNQILLGIVSVLVILLLESAAFILPALKNELGDSNFKYYLIINLILLWETVVFVAYLIWQAPRKKTLFTKIIAIIVGVIVFGGLTYITINILKSLL